MAARALHSKENAQATSEYIFLEALCEKPGKLFHLGPEGPQVEKNYAFNCHDRVGSVKSIGREDLSTSSGEFPYKRRKSNTGYVRKGCWSLEEDSLLCELVFKAESKLKWSDIALNVPGRSAKQCRERWSCNLDPSINRDPWSPAEDRDIIRHQRLLGNRWALIAKNLPGRTENAVKTRFKSILRARKREWKEEEDNYLLELHQRLGPDWTKIAEKLPTRTKNGVKTRHKILIRGEALRPPQYGAPNQIIFEEKMRSRGGYFQSTYACPSGMVDYTGNECFRDREPTTFRNEPIIKKEIKIQDDCYEYFFDSPALSLLEDA